MLYKSVVKSQMSVSTVQAGSIKLFCLIFCVCCIVVDPAEVWPQALGLCVELDYTQHLEKHPGLCVDC